MSEIDRWEDEVGLSSVNGSEMPDLDYVVNLNRRSILEMDFDEMDEALEKISAYMVYLAAEKSRLAEKLEVVRAVVDYKVNSETEKMIADNPRSFKTYGERKALVLRTNKSIRQLSDKCVKIAAKLKRIEELPRVVNDRMFTLRKIYDRKVNEQKGRE